MSILGLMKVFRKPVRPITIPFLYLHRWLRLTPSYLVVIWTYSELQLYLGDGPLFYGQESHSIAGSKRCSDDSLTLQVTRMTIVMDFGGPISFISTTSSRGMLIFTFLVYLYALFESSDSPSLVGMVFSKRHAVFPSHSAYCLGMICFMRSLTE